MAENKEQFVMGGDGSITMFVIGAAPHRIRTRRGTSSTVIAS
jgi:hypothetical protein